MAIGRTKAYSTKEFQKILMNNGFTFNRCNGSHMIYKRGDESIMINKPLNKMVARRLLKEYNLKH